MEISAECLVALESWSHWGGGCSIFSGGRGDDAPQKSASTFYYIASQEIEKGNFRAALSLLDSAIQYKQEYAPFYQTKGWIYERLGKTDSAIMVYQHSLKDKSHSPEVRLRLGELYLKQANYSDAFFQLKKTLQFYPDSARIYLMLGETAYMLKQYKFVIDYLNRYSSLVRRPKPISAKWLGLACYQSGNYKKAIELLGFYTRRYKDDFLALKYLGLAEFEMKNFNRALFHLNLISYLNEDDPDIYLYRSRYFSVHNKPDIAREQLYQGLQKAPGNIDIQFELAKWYYKKKDFQQSKHYLNNILTADSQYWSAYRYLGLIAESMNAFKQAKQFYELYLEKSYEDDSEIRLHLKQVTENQKR